MKICKRKDMTMEMNQITLQIPNPLSKNKDADITNPSSQAIFWWSSKIGLHFEFFIDPATTKPSLKVRFIEDPKFNLTVTMRQITPDGKSKTLGVEEISWKRLFGSENEFVDIKKHCMKNLEDWNEYSFVCDIKFSPADNAISSRFTKSNLENITKIANDQKFLDFTIKFQNGQELKVAKFILASKSPVFLKIFTTNMLENQKNEMFIPDIDYQIMKLVVNFMCSGTTDEFEYHIFDILIAADKYEILDLKKFCEMEISNGLTNDVIADVLIFADRYNAGLLKEKCIQYIHRNWDTVKASKECQEIFTYPDLILDVFRTFKIYDYPIKSIISNL